MWPAAVSGPRVARSTSRQATPGARASRPARWAAKTSVVQLDLPGRGSGPDDEGTADLAAVAAVGGAEPDGEEVALLDPAVGRGVAGGARVRAGADGGGEGGAVRAVVDQAALQLQREVALGAADQDRLQQFAERLVGDLGRYPQAGDLVLVLDQAELFDGAGQVGERDAVGDRAQGAVAGDGEVVLLDGEAVRAALAGEVGGGDGGVAVGRGQDEVAQRRPRPAAGCRRRRAQVDQGVLGARADQQGAAGAGRSPSGSARWPGA